MSFRVFGLTGGIGSGKSSVAKHLLARAVPVVDADRLARQAVLPGSAALGRIALEFGHAVLNAEGALDRGRLGELVFADDQARLTLNAIVHPEVRRLASVSFATIARSGRTLACYEVPLLYEAGLESTLSPVWVVNAPEASRYARLAARDGLDDVQIKARIAAQMPLLEKVNRADYVIENDGALRLLLERSDAVFDAMCRTLGVNAADYPKPNDGPPRVS